MITYLGSKRKLVSQIVNTVTKVPEVTSVLDLFSGTARVGKALKEKGYTVTANDYMVYAYKLAQCYVEADKNKYQSDAEKLIRELKDLEGKAGYFTETFCLKAKFFHPSNGEKIDAIRERIAELSLDPILEAILLSSLMKAANRVDSTCGVHMAYLKEYPERAYTKLYLQMPELVVGEGKALNLDVNKDMSGLPEVDLVYMDPPYNQHSYADNYHIWETLVLWDKPEVYGKANRRVDLKKYKSDFNSKPKSGPAISKLISELKTKYILMSFSNEGFLTKDSIISSLESRFETSYIGIDYKRYIGSQIGVYNNLGQKVGIEGPTHNKEYLFLAGPDSKKILESLTEDHT